MDDFPSNSIKASQVSNELEKVASNELDKWCNFTAPNSHPLCIVEKVQKWPVIFWSGFKNKQTLIQTTDHGDHKSNLWLLMSF